MNYKKKYLKYKKKYLKLKKILGGMDPGEESLDEIVNERQELYRLQEAYNKLRFDYMLLQNAYKAQESALQICFDSLKEYREYVGPAVSPAAG